MALDPIEKKPLYHFYPGSKILSVGSYGCNLECMFCQIYEISIQVSEVDYGNVSCEGLVEKAFSLKERKYRLHTPITSP